MGEQAKLHWHYHPELHLLPLPPLSASLLSVEKLSFTKPVPGAKKVGDHCFNNCAVALIILGNVSTPFTTHNGVYIVTWLAGDKDPESFLKNVFP